MNDRIYRIQLFEPSSEFPSADVRVAGMTFFKLGSHILGVCVPKGKDKVLVPWANIRHVKLIGE